MRILSLIIFLLPISVCLSQTLRWQQQADYKMEVSLDVDKHHLQGSQTIVYSNHSPDTLYKVHYHLYFNAFQPGSMMDVRSRNVKDPDVRIGNRISKLKDDEIGYQHITNLKQGEHAAEFSIYGTVMTVTLPTPIPPQSTTTLSLAFDAQVPIQIRRSGRENREGVDYTLTQWYPKLAEYDHQGWHTNQYVAREFFGVWGNYDVTISIPARYTIAGTGILQNPNEIGHGYENEGTVIKKQKGNIAWRFKAENVHDFAWAADADYMHDKLQVPGGPMLHTFYRKGEKTTHWKQVLPLASAFFQFMNKTFGQYPYASYSIIQGGDGGMEYQMCTMILGEGTLDGTVGTMVHEASHAWFQGTIATNEAQYGWMDEGFTRFAEYEALHTLFSVNNPNEVTYPGYLKKVMKGDEEPAALFSDFYMTNDAYRNGTYFKGCLLLTQLRYIMGEQNFYKGMLLYYNTWKFRHPEPSDFIFIMEKVSGMQLKWFLNYWIYTTKQIDFSIGKVEPGRKETEITIQRLGAIPMPLEVKLTFSNGDQQRYYIPLSETLGSKPKSDYDQSRTDLQVWDWVNPDYTFSVPAANVTSVEIDPDRELADINRSNNTIKVSH